MKWELIRDYTPDEDVNTITITTDDKGNTFSLKKALILCQYIATNTSTNNNEVVFSFTNNAPLFCAVNNCNSANANGDAILWADCENGEVLYASVEYQTTPLISPGAGNVGGASNRKVFVDQSAQDISKFLMRLGNSNYTFGHTKTRIRIYGVRA